MYLICFYPRLCVVHLCMTIMTMTTILMMNLFLIGAQQKTQPANLYGLKSIDLLTLNLL